MLRLTFTLAVALYAGFVIWGEPVDGMNGPLAAQASAADPAAPDYDRPVILGAESEPGVAVARAAVAEVVVPEASVIAASAPNPAETWERPSAIGVPVRISLVEPAARDDAGATTAVPDGAERMVVAGSRVNLRAGPSTANAVVGSLVRGAAVVVLGEAADGWVELRDEATGRTGFMAARFLEPA